MRINSISANQPNCQNQSAKLNFAALKLGKQNKYVTKETRELADRAVDLYESVVTKKLNADGIELLNSNGNSGFIKKGFPLILQKKINGDTVQLEIDSRGPRVADIEMHIIDKEDNECCTHYWYNSCGRGFSGKEEKEFFSIGADDPNENETKVFNKILKEFLDSSDKIIKMFK